MPSGSANFDNGLDFYCRVQRQRRDTDRRPRMPAAIAEDLYQQVRGAVDDLVRLAEIGCRIDEAGELDDPRQAIEIADRGLQDGDEVDRRDAGAVTALLDGEGCTDLADQSFAIGGD